MDEDCQSDQATAIKRAPSQSECTSKQIPFDHARARRAVAVLFEAPLLPLVFWLQNRQARAHRAKHHRREGNAALTMMCGNRAPQLIIRVKKLEVGDHVGLGTSTSSEVAMKLIWDAIPRSSG